MPDNDNNIAPYSMLQKEVIEIRKETAERTAEWSRWRGEMNIKMQTNIDQVTALAIEISKRLTDFDQNLNRRMDKQDLEIAKTLEQARATNGRMNHAENEIASLKTINEIRSDDVNKSISSKQAFWDQWGAYSALSVGVGGILLALFTSLHII